MISITRRGLLFVLSSPSGAGKTSLVRAILEKDANAQLSISYTTRPPRPSEVDGRDYIFVSLEKFKEMVEQGEFIEYAQVFGNLYGTPKQPIFEALEKGRDVLFDIDWQGTQQIAQNAKEDLVRLFILPPSYQALDERLHSRAQDSEEVIHNRMKSALDEISHWAEYDYVIINDDFQKSLDNVYSILQSERLKRRRQTGLVDFVKSLNPHTL
jgi:guanylate kinase